MSAFLGPIHYWLYNKIQIQEEMIQKVTQFEEELGLGLHLDEELIHRYGPGERRPLEEVIDVGNIHGWLQTLVAQAEYKLAYAVTCIAEKNESSLSQLNELFYQLGKEKTVFLPQKNAQGIYKGINDLLLDGMPCDHAYLLNENQEKKVVLLLNQCVHKQYWESVGGFVAQYYQLRDSFIKGLIQETGYGYSRQADGTIVIQEENANE